MNGEKISIIVPAYNLEPWLPRCLNSILSQSYENLEVIVVDDGSSDNTYGVIQEYAQYDSRVKPIHQDNGGVTSARLRGLREATGSWVGFVDGDDVLEPEMYDRLLHNAHSHGADISHCGYQRNFPDGGVEYHYNTGEVRIQDCYMGLKDLLEERLIEPGLCSKLYRKKLFDGLEDKMDLTIKNNEDMLMNYYLFAKAEKSVYEDVCPYHYILRDGSASRRKMNAHRIYDPVTVREIILAECPQELQEDARQALLRVLLYVYALLTVEEEQQYAAYRKDIREKLMANQIGFAVLTKRNQILARMIQYVPWLFELAFKGYVTLFLNGNYQ